MGGQGVTAATLAEAPFAVDPPSSARLKFMFLTGARLSNSGFEAPSGFDDVKRVSLDEVSRLIDIEFDFKLHGVAAPYDALE